MLIIGHRGAGSYAPHNSRQSIAQAISMGVHMIETDIRITRDNVPVICHDHSIGLGAIEDLTWEEIKNYPLSNGEFLPSLEEILCLFASKVRFNLEIKETCCEKLDCIMNKVMKIDLNNPLFSSFSLPIVKALRKTNYDIAFLLEKPLHTEKLLTLLIDNNISTLNLYYPLVNQDLVTALQKNSIKLILWTDFLMEIWNTQELYEKAYDYNPYGFITGKPDQLRIFLERKKL